MMSDPNRNVRPILPPAQRYGKSTRCHAAQILKLEKKIVLPIKLTIRIIISWKES